MADKKYIYIKELKVKVEVSESVYKANCRMDDYEKYLRKKDKKGGRVLYNNLDNEGMLGEEMIADRHQLSVEEQVETKLVVEKLRSCLAMLPDGERELIKALFFDGLSERELSKRTGVHNMTIHNKKIRILKKLKNLLEK